jgi:hypothetical protein
LPLKLTEGIKSTPWKMSGLERTLADLKNNKARVLEVSKYNY